MQHTVDNNNIPPPNPLLAQHPRQHLDLVQQPRIGKRLLGSRDRRVPDNRGAVAMPIAHMAVDAVVGGGNLAVREPGPVVVGRAVGGGFGVFGDGLGWGTVPVEVRGVVGPEGLGGLEGEVVD